MTLPLFSWQFSGWSSILAKVFPPKSWTWVISLQCRQMYWGKYSLCMELENLEKQNRKGECGQLRFNPVGEPLRSYAEYLPETWERGKYLLTAYWSLLGKRLFFHCGDKESLVQKVEQKWGNVSLYLFAAGCCCNNWGRTADLQDVSILDFTNGKFQKVHNNCRVGRILPLKLPF